MNPGSSLKLGRIFGIEIGIHYSWFLIAILIILSLSGYFSEEHGTWASSVIWSMSILTAILFFAAIIVHELSHAFVARLKGLPVSSVTLFALGGVARIEKESENPQTEFWLGIVGPITSAVIGGVCLGAARVIGWTPGSDPDSPALAILVWLGFVNVALAAFNMLPGFPMDGGRVLRAIVWRITGDRDRATAAASKTGHLLAVMFIVLGLFMFFGGAGFGGLWIAFIGWFLLNAAKASYLEVELRRALGDLRVENLIENNFPVIESNTSIDQIVDDFLLKSGERWFMIVEQG
ncbi:MAG TPA: site-2 protease family protein, partial [Pyrinomonadaceae bacterium]|nr:site-2 protease family protein [Pyrinomonadaceae bacterium]